MEIAIDNLEAIQAAVAEADFNGKACSNALYFVFTVLHGYNEELHNYTTRICEEIRQEIRDGKAENI